jgi:hypothetical protein
MTGVRGAVRAQRDDERLLLDRDRLAALVQRTEIVEPVLGRHGAGLLESPAEQGAGRLVVEDDVAGPVHEKRWGGQAARAGSGPGLARAASATKRPRPNSKPPSVAGHAVSSFSQPGACETIQGRNRVAGSGSPPCAPRRRPACRSRDARGPRATCRAPPRRHPRAGRKQS